MIATAMLGVTAIVSPAAAQLSQQMRDGIPGATYVSVYSSAERREAAFKVLRLAYLAPARDPVSLTPNSPYAPDGSRLSVWKPSFVIGTASGGEIGVNFWGLHNEGHVNVAFTVPPNAPRYLDCRILSTGPVTYKIYRGAGETLGETGERTLQDGHLFVVVPATENAELVSVELWPTPTSTTMGFLGCDISGVF